MACATTSSILFWRLSTDPTVLKKRLLATNVSQWYSRFRDARIKDGSRASQEAAFKKKDNPYASQKHVRIELENQYRHWTRISAPDPT